MRLGFIFAASKHNVSFSFRLNDNHKTQSYGGVTSGFSADTSGNCSNSFGDGCVSVIELSLLFGLYYPLTPLDILSCSSYWNYWTTVITLIYKPFLVFPSATVVLVLLFEFFAPQESVSILRENFWRKVFSTGKKGIILIIKVKKQAKRNISYKMSLYESIRGSIAGSISNLELKYSWILSGQNSCQFNGENKISSLFFEAYNKICVIY